MKTYFVLSTMALAALTGCNNTGKSEQQTAKAQAPSDQQTQTSIPHCQSALMHIAINAIDVDSTLAFYKNAFGYTKTYQWTQAANPQNGQILFKGRGIYLDVGGNAYLEIFPTGKRGQSMKTGTVAHFSLVVSNIDEAYKKALQFGAKKNATTEPTFWDGTPTTIELNGEPKLKERVAYIAGPNGEAIELYELLTPIATQ